MIESHTITWHNTIVMLPNGESLSFVVSHNASLYCHCKVSPHCIITKCNLIEGLPDVLEGHAQNKTAMKSLPAGVMANES